MATVSDVMSALSSFPMNSERGTVLEKLMVRYFRVHPVLSQEYDTVCRWVDWNYRNHRTDNGYRSVDDVTDEIHRTYRDDLSDDVSKDDIYYFVYGQLPNPDYRERYAPDLKKMLTPSKTPQSRARFDQLSVAGRDLMKLHINHEKIEPYPAHVVVKQKDDPADRETWRVTKLNWKRRRNPGPKKPENYRTESIRNCKVTISGTAAADKYMLGAGSALSRIIDLYQAQNDRASGFVNDPHDSCDEVGNSKYVVAHIGRVTRIAVDTVRIVKGLR